MAFRSSSAKWRKLNKMRRRHTVKDVNNSLCVKIEIYDIFRFMITWSILLISFDTILMLLHLWNKSINSLCLTTALLKQPNLVQSCKTTIRE